MRRLARLALVAGLAIGAARAQTFPVEELHRPRDPSNAIRIMVLGDGWTQDSLTQDLPVGTGPNTPDCKGCTGWDTARRFGAPSYHRAVQACVDGLFTQEPFKSYEAAFGITRMDVVSESVTNTYFGGQFVLDTPLWKRLFSASIQRNQKLDQLLEGKSIAASVVIQNDVTHSGASLLDVSWVNAEPNDLLEQYSFAHELGHNLFGLADEYYDSYELNDARRKFVNGAVNIDLNSDPMQTKWARWVGFPGSESWPNAFGESDNATEHKFPQFNGKRALGCYPGGAMVHYTYEVYHSRPTCLMNSLFIGDAKRPNALPPICEVCREAAVDRIAERYRIVSSVDPPPDVQVEVASGGSQTFTLHSDVKVATGLKVQWELTTGEKQSRYGDAANALSLTLSAADLGTAGLHRLTALVKDASAGPPNDRYKKLPYEVSWNIEVRPAGESGPAMLQDTAATQ